MAYFDQNPDYTRTFEVDLDDLLKPLRLIEPRSFKPPADAPPPPLPADRAELVNQLSLAAKRYAATDKEPNERWGPRMVRPKDDYSHAPADALMETAGVQFHITGAASYSPRFDTLSIPHPLQFADGATFYATALHELTHWTGPRLGRRLFRDPQRFNPMHPDFEKAYAQEEMIAEFGSAFLCNKLGIYPPSTLFSDYLGHWSRTGGLDYLPTAAAHASQAADYILNRRH